MFLCLVEKEKGCKTVPGFFNSQIIQNLNKNSPILWKTAKNFESIFQLT